MYNENQMWGTRTGRKQIERIFLVFILTKKVKTHDWYLIFGDGGGSESGRGRYRTAAGIPLASLLRSTVRSAKLLPSLHFLLH